MDKIEKIRQEIERRKKELDEQIVDIYDSKAVLRKDELQKLLSFLDTLSEEPNKSLEEEVDRYLEPIHAADIQFEPFTQMTKCARHFAEWGADHLRDSTKMMDEDEMDMYQRGVRDMRESMMKWAVEGEIKYYPDFGGILIAEAQVGSPFHCGDKVIMIVIKED